MKITRALDTESSPNPHGVHAAKIHQGAQGQVIHITLKPGECLKRHTTPVDVFFYILEGEGVVEVGDEREHVCRDMLIESPAAVPHLLENDRNSDFRVLVVKAPAST